MAHCTGYIWPCEASDIRSLTVVRHENLGGLFHLGRRHTSYVRIKGVIDDIIIDLQSDNAVNIRIFVKSVQEK